MTLDVFAAGGVLIDCIVEADGAVRLERVGGNAVYAAVGAAIAGASAGVVGRVPADYPETALAGLARRGIDVSGIGRVAGERAAPEWFLHDRDGGRRDHLHARVAAFEEAHGRVDRLAPAEAAAWQRWLESRRGDDDGFVAFRARCPVRVADVPADHWHAQGVHLGANVVPETLALAREARRRGRLVSLDPGFRVAELGEAALSELLALVDVFLPSEKELAILCPGLPAEEAVKHLAGRARGIVAAKLGAAGALVQRRGDSRPVAVPAFPARATDPTGAGDAFGGALLAGLVAGSSPVEAAGRAAVVASIVVETSGALAALDAGRAAFARRLALAR